MALRANAQPFVPNGIYSDADENDFSAEELDELKLFMEQCGVIDNDENDDCEDDDSKDGEEIDPRQLEARRIADPQSMCFPCSAKGIPCSIDGTCPAWQWALDKANELGYPYKPREDCIKPVSLKVHVSAVVEPVSLEVPVSAVVEQCSFFFGPKGCDRKNCKRSHKPAHDAPVCTFYARGSCTKPNCRFLHPSAGGGGGSV